MECLPRARSAAHSARHSESLYSIKIANKRAVTAISACQSACAGAQDFNMARRRQFAIKRAFSAAQAAGIFRENASLNSGDDDEEEEEVDEEEEEETGLGERGLGAFSQLLLTDEEYTAGAAPEFIGNMVESEPGADDAPEASRPQLLAVLDGLEAQMRTHSSALNESFEALRAQMIAQERSEPALVVAGELAAAALRAATLVAPAAAVVVPAAAVAVPAAAGPPAGFVVAAAVGMAAAVGVAAGTPGGMQQVQGGVHGEGVQEQGGQGEEPPQEEGTGGQPGSRLAAAEAAQGMERAVPVEVACPCLDSLVLENIQFLPTLDSSWLPTDLPSTSPPMCLASLISASASRLSPSSSFPGSSPSLTVQNHSFESIAWAAVLGRLKRLALVHCREVGEEQLKGVLHACQWLVELRVEHSEAMSDALLLATTLHTLTHATLVDCDWVTSAGITGVLGSFPALRHLKVEADKVPERARRNLLRAGVVVRGM
ncbi:hypothetical protein CLOP_g1542 [Closterium sp. NIES-67]|nr:hypothetical protein CLOP_g1542 [Closterium sp. NIES-67]